MGRAYRITMMLPLLILASVLLGLWGWSVRAQAFGRNRVDILLHALGSMVIARARHFVPWDQLPEASRRLDREIVRATLDAIAHAGGKAPEPSP